MKRDQTVFFSLRLVTHLNRLNQNGGNMSTVLQGTSSQISEYGVRLFSNKTVLDVLQQYHDKVAAIFFFFKL